MKEVAPIRGILVVDDDEFILKTTTFTLHEMGFGTVLTANRAIKALAHITTPTKPIDVILCDLNMPEMDGIEFLRRLMEEGYEGGILLFSGEDARTLSTAKNLAKAYSLNVLGAVSKPVQSSELAEILATWHGPLERKHPSVTPLIDAATLSTAIEAGEIIPHYQPKVDLRNGRTVGAEILARWDSPMFGMVFPDAFITVAENEGLIDSMTFRLLASALEQSSAWKREGIELELALNVSMTSLQRLEFADQLLEVIYHTGGHAQNIVLEVTESQFIKDSVEPMNVLLRLRMKRIKLSIDDFGTGYSSLAQLRDLPFDQLKIDQSFVRGAARDADAHSILKSSIEMGRQLGMTVIAEGVENLGDWKRVAEMNCDLAQGYFIGRPMAGERIPGWLRQWQARCQVISNKN